MESKGFMNRLFPVTYDFYKMLGEQASAGFETVGALLVWLETGTDNDEKRLKDLSKKADDLRMTLEKNLVEAFTTPFDRGDIYYISVTMRRSLDYAVTTLLAMKDFDVKPDGVIRGMAEKLKQGAETFAAAVGALKKEPKKAEQLIPPIRASHMEIEQLYRDGMCAVFGGGDAMDALRHREIYHHLKDASKYLDDAVDILHRIIVRLT